MANASSGLAIDLERGAMKHSDHGIVKNEKAEEQPADRRRAQTAHRTDPDRSVSREETRDPKLTRTERKPHRRDDRRGQPKQ